MAKDKVLLHVMQQIISDVEQGDVEAVEELLGLLYTEDTKQYFIGFLPEELIEEIGYNLNELYKQNDE
jgi:hypothetical protein